MMSFDEFRDKLKYHNVTVCGKICTMAPNGEIHGYKYNHGLLDLEVYSDIYSLYDEYIYGSKESVRYV